MLCDVFRLACGSPIVSAVSCFSHMPKLQQIVGHSGILTELERDLQTDNVSHAYLFAGPQHLGKMTTAHWFASKLLCADVSDDQRKEAERSIERLTHPDLLVLDQLWIDGVCDDWNVIARTSNVQQDHRAKKPPAKTDIISIDDIRALQNRLYETAIGKHKCCIIRSAERMRAEAANAFLKILEEPPPGLVFILTTQALSSLLPTLISRTRILRFRSIPHKDISPLLDGVSDDDRKFILRVAQGAPGIVRSFRDSPELLRVHSQIHAKAISFWQTSSLKDRLQILKPLQKRGDESDLFLLHLALTLRDRALTEGRSRAFHQLTQGLTTNAHRGLLLQRFVLTI